MIYNKEKNKWSEPSPHLEEIIGKKPHWLIRLGISGMLLMLLILLFVAWWVKYPDIIKAPIYISTPNPPIDLVCPTNAQIEKIFIKTNNAHLVKGSPLIVLKSTTSYEQVQKLKTFLQFLAKDSLLGKIIPISENFSKLGSLQNTYNQLTTFLEEYNEHIEHTPYKKRIFFLEKIIQNNTQSLKSSNKQFSLEIQDQNLVEKRDKRAEILFDKAVISEQDYEIEKQKFLQKEIQLESNRTSLIDKNTYIISLQRELAELKIQQSHFNHEIRDNIKNTAKTLNAQVEEWTNTFVIIAPINGKISIFKEFNKGDFITAGSYLLTMLPFESQELFAYGNFPVANAGKLKENNKAIIKLHAYPYREYGSIDGFVETISDFPINDMYSVKIRLPNKLETGYSNKIVFKQRLSGEAELITEDRSLLSRIFSNFKYFVDKNIKE